MKIAIVGPGALGSLLAALLARKKEDVWILDKDADRAKKIAKDGISVEGIGGSWRAEVRATADPKDIESAGLVIICVKSYDTKRAVAHARPLISDTTAVLTLQNGIGNIELLSEVAGEEKVLGGVTNTGATLLAPGRVRYAGKGETVIGRLDGAISVELRRVRELFISAGLETRISRDVKAAVWSKLIINVGINALTAITRLTNGKLLDYEGARNVMRLSVNEAVKVARRKRIKLAYDDPLSKVEAVCEATANNVSSMLQDIVKKKRTEIDAINGVICRHADELGIPAPANNLLVDLVRTIEASYKDTVA